jgi:nitronate monooxygenase
MAAALALGACAVIVGTRLIATEEADAAPAYKQAVVAAGPEDVITTAAITGNPASWLSGSIADFQEQPALTSKKWLDLWSAGQSVAQTEAILPIRDVIQDMLVGFHRATRRLDQMVVDD